MIHMIDPITTKPKPESECVSEEDIKRKWGYKNHHAIYEGTTLHDYIENYLNNKILPESKVSAEGLLFQEIERNL